MTRFMEKSFTVPASAGSKDYCLEHGHTMPDSKGRCLRCASRTTTQAYKARLQRDDEGHTLAMREILDKMPWAPGHGPKDAA